MKLMHIMERTQLIESVKFGWLQGQYEAEVNDEDIYSDEATLYVTLKLGPDGQFINVIANVKIDAHEVDASFGYEYGSISGTHRQTDVDGGAEVVSVENDFDSMDSDEIVALARYLRVPGRKKQDLDTIWKYFVHAVGGEKKLTDDVHELVVPTLDKIVDDKLEQDRNSNDYDGDGPDDYYY